MFRKLNDGKLIDDNIISYINSYLITNPGCEIYIGTDSQNNRKYSAYVTVIALRNGRNGAHVLYSSTHLPKIRDRFSRLWKEAEASIEIAELFKQNNISVKAIELDFNKKKTAGSNMMIAPAVGYVTGMGYNTITKPDELISCKAADHILRK